MGTPGQHWIRNPRGRITVFAYLYLLLVHHGSEGLNEDGTGKIILCEEKIKHCILDHMSVLSSSNQQSDHQSPIYPI